MQTKTKPSPIPRRNGHLPTPANPEAERALVACALNSPALLAGDLGRVSSEVFHDLRLGNLWLVLREMHKASVLIDPVTVDSKLRKEKRAKECGGMEFVGEVWDATPSAANWPYYLELVREPFAKRKLAGILYNRLQQLDDSETAPRDFVLGIQAELETAAKLGGTNGDKAALKIWKASELLKHEQPAHLQLVGDNEIVMGYEGVVVLAGPGSAGKSLCTASLALAGARGNGTWMGRKVHRQFKTLIIQAENGVTRLQKEIRAMSLQHPELDIEGHIFFSEPPEGGLPFHRGDFRNAVREEILRLQPDLVILDPWSQVATEDAAKEVVDKLGEIRSCFPADSTCPGLLIVAHTKKPRPEDVRKGRGLVYMVSGSIALPNTARCVYCLLPWSDDPEDSRIYWSCVKLNNGEMYASTVWHRKFGTFFVRDEKTNAKEFGRTEEDDRHKLSEDHLRACFEKVKLYRPGDLVKALIKVTGCGQATAWRAISEGDDGHLREFMMRDSATGKLKLKEAAEQRD